MQMMLADSQSLILYREDETGRGNINIEGTLDDVEEKRKRRKENEWEEK